ncbi:hypothetical protein SNE40_014678 [Patella caerulea]|uniref:[histone H3]-trimethyl-L-lysine(4) demethylase n=1 Tax=Patella caerulea TaxID=87958 RepID=A0AAN8JG44_PATCE
MSDPYVCFKPPPEAPVFTPTEEEFADPLGYIAKIRPVAEKSGICKIKPPPDWQPPFAVDVETFKFTPRIQKLNELEAKSRIKLNFLDQLARFWELQGCSLRIPTVERKLLDLNDLYKNVDAEGGYECVNNERKWSKVSTKLGFPTGKGIGSIIRSHYERILYPYLLFKKGETLKFDKLKKSNEEEDKTDGDYKPRKVEADSTSGHGRKATRSNKEEPVINYSANSELKKLQFFGAGPKAAVPSGPSDEKTDVKDSKTGKSKSKSHHDNIFDEGVFSAVFDKYHCRTCGRGDGDEYMLLCDGCDDAFHTYCLIPPLAEVPKGDWRCPYCVKQACSKPQDPYGFEQSKREYSLQSFGEMADHFKSTYFNMPVHMVPTESVEKEFWRLVSCLEEDVCVQYGADIHASEMGSGFPTANTKHLCPEDEEYVNSGWNLNNLAVLEQSVLCHINADISGMKIPWCYVGMCFSSFCWHNEDHWSYSINYLHWGEPKTWYGVPGSKAEEFELAMKHTAPELFETAPDLLHQLTTIMNPNILSEQGVPICRTNQHAGEFIVTFPRAYHAGFNQGYNFAEAVNFCPADWLNTGKACIEHYRQLGRQCVFSHEELVCKMAAEPNSLDLNLAAETHRNLLTIVDEERKLRKNLSKKGMVHAEREAFELLPDDERQCDYCKTTCFLSAVTCDCRPNKVVCLHHVSKLCSCPSSNLCLRYRYSLDELPAMLDRLKIRAESFDNWNLSVKTALDAKDDDKLELSELRELITEFEEKRFPETELYQTLVMSVTEAEKCADVANQLVSKKVRTRNRQSIEGKYIVKLTHEELSGFYEQVVGLPCKIKETKLIKELLNKVNEFQDEAQQALEAETPDSEKLEKLIDLGLTLDVDLQEIPKLRQVLLQAKWLDDVRVTLQDPQSVTLDIMRKMIEAGVGLTPHPAVEKAMGELQELLTISERWEEKARICLQARPRHVMATLEGIINESKVIPAYLPNVSALKEAVRKAREWSNKVDSIQNGDSHPYVDVLESLVNKGRPIPVRLDVLPQIEAQVTTAKSWKERTARTFLKKNSTYTLLEVLSPRIDIGIYSSGKNKKKKIREGERKDGENNNNGDFKIEETRDPAAIVASFKAAENHEYELMKELRHRNCEKILSQSSDAKFCVCRKGASGMMLQCELCKDWFHGTCVPLPKSSNLKNKTSQAAVMQAAKDMKFLCPLCLRSRRPRLEAILSLLVSLQKLPVRLLEGEALQCLTERAMAWQDRARQSLTTTELASALAKLSVLSQKMVEQAAREKTEKIINAELMKAASNPDLQDHLASVTQSAFSGMNTVATMSREGTMSSVYGVTVDTDSSQSSIQMSPQSSQMSDDLPGEVEATIPSGMTSEHAYSSVSKATTTSSPRKHQRKTPLIPRQLETPALELSITARQQLEDLMMEGDLLEVSLDETQHIWRILQACQPRTDDKFLEFEDAEGTELIPREKVDKTKVKIKKEDKEKKLKRKKIIGPDGVEIISPKKNKTNQDPDKPKKRKIKIKTKDSSITLEAVEKENTGKGKDKSPEKKKDKIKKKRKGKLNPDGTPIERKKRIKKEKKLLGDDDDDEEAADDCSAIKCLRPSGDEVNWVQCDKCELWFHLLCIGLASDEVTEEEDYVCFQCVQITRGVIPPYPHIKQEDEYILSRDNSMVDNSQDLSIKEEAEDFEEEMDSAVPGEENVETLMEDNSVDSVQNDNNVETADNLLCEETLEPETCDIADVSEELIAPETIPTVDDQSEPVSSVVSDEPQTVLLQTDNDVDSENEENVEPLSSFEIPS